jgi:hypothetical protein
VCAQVRWRNTSNKSGVAEKGRCGHAKEEDAANVCTGTPVHMSTKSGVEEHGTSGRAPPWPSGSGRSQSLAKSAARGPGEIARLPGRRA